MAILLLAATAVVGAGQATNDTNATHALTPPDGAAVLDPAQVHASIQAGEPFELPTPDGSVTVEATERVQETIDYKNGPGELTIERPPNVWELRTLDGDGEGAVLSFEHTLRAWVSTPTEATQIEPLVETPGTSEDVLYEVLDFDTLESSGTGVGILSHIQVFRSVYAYVDTQYRNQYGSCCWADQIVYILDLSNQDFNDVELEYYFDNGVVDTDFDTWDIDAAMDTLLNKPWNGADKRSYWSYKDFGGCDVGKATMPGWSFLIQHQPDDCHFDQVPTTDAQRAYLTSHELGKNNDALPAYHWSQTDSSGHEHRSVMKDSLWGHYHNCWSQTNLNRMASYLGTSVVESPC